MNLKKIINDLEKVKGLDNIRLLSRKDKDVIKKIENANNKGILACLSKQYTLILTHNSSFRAPAGKIVVKKAGKILFPGIKFPEVKAKNVVSSSPSLKVHNFLVKRFKLRLEDEATLLIGLDL